MWFYVDKDRQQMGPVSVDELKRLLSTGAINKRTHLWQEGRAEWSRLEELAGSLGIAFSAPPPTPAATMVMNAAMLPQQPPIAAPQPAYTPPPSFSPPSYSTPNSAPPSYAAPSFPTPGYPAPNQQPNMAHGFSPAAPAYPNVQAPMAKSGGSNALKGFASAFFGICLVGYYGYKYLGPYIPAISDRQAASALVDAAKDLSPARDEIESVYSAKNTCPGKELPIKVEVESNVFTDFVYGTIANNCALQVDIPKDYKLKQIAGTRILYVLSNRKWTCNMSADAKFLPSGCNKIDATEE